MDAFTKTGTLQITDSSTLGSNYSDFGFPSQTLIENDSTTNTVISQGDTRICQAFFVESQPDNLLFICQGNETCTIFME